MKIVNMVARYSLLVLLVMGLSVTGASAATFFAEAFAYADGQLTDSGGGANVSGGLWTGHSGTTYDDNVDVIGGQAQVLNSGSEDVSRAAGQTMAAGQTWYFAARFTVNFTGVAGDSINNDYFIHFKDSGTGYRARVFLDDPNDGANDYTLGFAASGSQAVKWATDLTFGTEYTMVASYDFDTGAAELWVDPVDATSLSITDTGTTGTLITVLALRQDYLSGTANNEILFNDVSMGDTFDDVLGSVPVELLGFTVE